MCPCAVSFLPLLPLPPLMLSSDVAPATKWNVLQLIDCSPLRSIPVTGTSSLTMGSADFSQFVVTTANETACETSTLKVHALSPHLSAASTLTSGNLLGFIAFGQLTRISEPYMRFLFVGPRVCLQLPSDSTSRWTPLLFSYVLRRCLRVLGTFTR